SNLGPSSAAERGELRHTISIGSPLCSVMTSHRASGLLPKWPGARSASPSLRYTAAASGRVEPSRMQFFISKPWLSLRAQRSNLPPTLLLRWGLLRRSAPRNDNLFVG